MQSITPPNAFIEALIQWAIHIKLEADKKKVVNDICPLHRKAAHLASGGDPALIEFLEYFDETIRGITNADKLTIDGVLAQYNVHFKLHNREPGTRPFIKGRLKSVLANPENVRQEELEQHEET
jgi:hypothetical protein